MQWMDFQHTVFGVLPLVIISFLVFIIFIVVVLGLIELLFIHLDLQLFLLFAFRVRNSPLPLLILVIIIVVLRFSTVDYNPHNSVITAVFVAVLFLPFFLFFS